MAVESELMLTEYFLAAADVLEGQFQRRANKYVRLLLCNFLHKSRCSLRNLKEGSSGCR